MQNAVLIQML